MRTLRFLDPPGTHELGEAIGTYKTQVYKVRWNQPNPFSYREDAAPGPRERFSIKPQVEIRVGVAARD